MTATINSSALSALSALKAKAPEFQEYTSARQAMRMMTPTGKKITFARSRFITQDEESIAYLDEQIELGLQGVTKGAKLTSEDLDPMAALKKRAVEEYLATQAAIAAGTGDAGNTGTSAGGQQLVKPASSKTVAN